MLVVGMVTDNQHLIIDDYNHLFFVCLKKYFTIDSFNYSINVT